MSVVSKVIEEDSTPSLRDDIYDVIDRLGAVYCEYQRLPDTFNKILEFSVRSVNRRAVTAFSEKLYIHCQKFLKDEGNSSGLPDTPSVMCVLDNGRSAFSSHTDAKATVYGLIVLPQHVSDEQVQALTLDLKAHLPLLAAKILCGAEGINIQLLEPKEADQVVFPDKHLNALCHWLHRAYLLTAIEDDDPFGIKIYPWDLPGKSREAMDRYFFGGAKHCNAFRERL